MSVGRVRSSTPIDISQDWEVVSKTLEESGEVPDVSQIATWSNLSVDTDNSEEALQQKLGTIFNTLCELTGKSANETIKILLKEIAFSTSIGRAHAILDGVRKANLSEIPQISIEIKKKDTIHFELIYLFHHIYLELAKTFTRSSRTSNPIHLNLLPSSEAALFFGQGASEKEKEDLITTRAKYSNFLEQMARLLKTYILEPQVNSAAGIDPKDQRNFVEDIIEKGLQEAFNSCWLLQYVVDPGQRPQGLLIQKTTEGFLVNFRTIDTNQSPPISRDFSSEEQLLLFLKRNWGQSVFFTKFQRFFSNQAGLWQTVQCTQDVLYTLATLPITTVQALLAHPTEILDITSYRQAFLPMVYQERGGKIHSCDLEAEQYLAKILYAEVNPPKDRKIEGSLFPLETAVIDILPCFIAKPVKTLPFQYSIDRSNELRRAVFAVQEIFELRDPSSFKAFMDSVAKNIPRFGSTYALGRLIINGENLTSLKAKKKTLEEHSNLDHEWISEFDLIYILIHLLQITYEIYKNKSPSFSYWIPIWKKMPFALKLLKKAEVGSFSRFSEVQQVAFSQIPDVIKELESINLTALSNATLIENISWEKVEKQLTESPPSTWIIHLVADKEQLESVFLIRKYAIQIEEIKQDVTTKPVRITEQNGEIIKTQITWEEQQEEIKRGNPSRIEVIQEKKLPIKTVREEVRFEFYDPTRFGFVSGGENSKMPILVKDMLNFLENACGTDPKVVKLIKLPQEPA